MGNSLFCLTISGVTECFPLYVKQPKTLAMLQQKSSNTKYSDLKKNRVYHLTTVISDALLETRYNLATVEQFERSINTLHLHFIQASGYNRLTIQ